MKTPEEIIRWCDTMLNRHPNIGDTNFFNSIKDYMKEQRPQGEWITLDRNDRFKTGLYKCNLCGYKNPVPEEASKNFCPNCGADMRKGGAE